MRCTYMVTAAAAQLDWYSGLKTSKICEFAHGSTHVEIVPTLAPIRLLPVVIWLLLSNSAVVLHLGMLMHTADCVVYWVML